jgi:SagB-type dehydrogenase family enzyme
VRRLRRRRFLQLALASALPRRARAALEAGPTALDAHHATRNTWHGPFALGSVFRARPLPYKPYPDAPRVALPDEIHGGRLSLAEAMRAPAPALSADPLPLGVLASLLRLANGVTAVVAGSDPPESRRAAPSAGALYAGEVYVAAERVAGLAPGVYSYAVDEHALVSIGAGAVPEEARGAACAVLLSNVFERYAWRYAERGYRYALIDSGHIGENLRLAAAAAGVAHQALPRFHDDAANALLAIDGRDEAVCALHALGGASSAQSRALVETRRAERSLPEPLRYHEATKLVPGAAAPVEATRFVRETPPPPGDGPTLPVARAILQRRSARAFREEPIEGGALRFALAAARSAGLGLRVVVHRVAELAPGLYAAEPGAGALVPLRAGSFEHRLVRACLFQERAGTAAAAFAFVADFGRALAEGERSYRDQLLEAGAAAQRLYLAAESLGLAARNLAAFYDDALDELLAVARPHAVVHLTLLGREA